MACVESEEFVKHIHDLTNGACGVQHLPNNTTNRVRLYAAGVEKLGVCPEDPQLDHVHYPSGWTVEGTGENESPAIIICREDREFARIVPAEGQGPNAYTIKTAF